VIRPSRGRPERSRPGLQPARRIAGHRHVAGLTGRCTAINQEHDFPQAAYAARHCRADITTAITKRVIAGLDPAIHRLAKEMDPRVKPAGDTEKLVITGF
jgi:hypothetical protein